MIKLAIFDVDGVLADSLRPHLKICIDKNNEYRLGLNIPDEVKFKNLVKNGGKISPMNLFFQAVGFPKDVSEKAYAYYKNNFSKEYNTELFPDVSSTLRKYYDSGLHMAIATSNHIDNIKKILGSNMRYFSPEYIFTQDNKNYSSKKEFIGEIYSMLEIGPKDSVFIGDQPSDFEAAKSSFVHFLGVSYGWGFSGNEKGFPVVGSFNETYDYISKHLHDFP